jgi:hypothetical protein
MSATSIEGSEGNKDIWDQDYGLLQRAYLLATSCTLRAHSKPPNDQACLSLAQALLKSASASMEVAWQLPAAVDDARAARKQLLYLVSPTAPWT